MKEFFEQNYKTFISKVKDKINNEIKLKKYQEFVKHLEIQMLALSGGDIEIEKAIGEDKPLLDEGQRSKNYFVTENVVRELRNEDISVNNSLETTAENISGYDPIIGAKRVTLRWRICGKDDFCFVQRRIAETILEILKDEIKDQPLDVIKSPDDFWHTISFMNRYYKGLASTYHLPAKEFLSIMAYKTYENRENKGIICFVEKEKWKESWCGVKFSELSIDTAGFQEGNEDNIRKLLEMSKSSYEGDKSKCLLFDPRGNVPCWGLALEEKMLKEQECFFVYFMGNGGWKIKRGNETVFIYSNNSFWLEDEDRDEEIRKELPEMIRNKDMFIKLIHCLEMQKHGALVIIAKNAHQETERLCDKYQRGTKIEKFRLSDPDADSIISGFCSVDGAIFIDFAGYCHGYGVILDGKAKATGVRGRGARYNSALNYIAGSKKYAIVVSEDKDKKIKILPPSYVDKR